MKLVNMKLLLYQDDRVLPLLEKARMLIDTTKQQMVLAEVEVEEPLTHSLQFVRDMSGFKYPPVQDLKGVHGELVKVYNTTDDASSITNIKTMLKALEQATVAAYAYYQRLKKSTPLHDSFARSLVPDSIPSIHITVRLSYEHVLTFEYTYFIRDITVVLKMWGDLISLNGDLTTKLGATVLMRSLCKV